MEPKLTYVEYPNIIFDVIRHWNFENFGETRQHLDNFVMVELLKL